MSQPVSWDSTTWVIERHIFEEEQELALIEEIKKQGGEIKLIDPLSKHNFDWEGYGWHLENRPTIFRGSLTIGKKAIQQAWYSGVICHPKNFNCSTYYTYWGKWMLNKYYWLMPIADLPFKVDFICDYLMQTVDWCTSPYEFFIKPDSKMKQFAGKIVRYDNLIQFKDLEPETLVLVSPVKKVNKKWRFVVADNKVITGSQYYENGKYITEQNTVFNNGVAYFLESILKKITWQPDPIYTVNVCESKGEFSILELNSFSYSNLYTCDLSKVVKAANEIAIKEWKEVI